MRSCCAQGKNATKRFGSDDMKALLSRLTRNCRRLLCFLFLVSCTAVSFSQDTPAMFEGLSVEEGLSQSRVRCILQDSDGFLWFGTRDGLNRYDGYQFKVYKRTPEQS